MNEATRKEAPLDEPLPPFPNPSAHIEFYKKFKREADEYDNDFIKKYDDEANTTLIFAGLFSAVTSAFIVNVQSQLQPDYTQMSYELLKIIASASLGALPTGPEAAFPQWTGPDAAIVHVQAILYSSLAASLLAAFIAMLGRQWLNRFAQAEISGSIADRSRNRLRKLNGMATWQFDLVMECLPLMLQFALFLLGYALSNYLFFVNKVVAGVVIGFTAFGLLFYLLISFAATLSYSCPFQTPVSLMIRFMIRFDNEHRMYIRRSREWLESLFSFPRKWKQPRSLEPDGVNWPIIGDPTEFATAGPPPRSFNKAVWNGYVLDSASIIRLFGISTDADVVVTITKFVPEIVWHAGIRTTPLDKLYSTLLECFDRSSGRLVVISKLRNEAYLGAKALLHLAIQRQCFCDGSDEDLFKSISDRHQIMGSEHHEGDSDLESTLNIIDRVFGRPEPISWSNFSPTATHLAWMSHILLYRAWDAHRRGQPLPDDISQFLFHSFRLDPPPRAPVITDCLLIVGLVLGIELHIDELLVIDKSHEPCQQIDRIYERLRGMIQNPHITVEEIRCALGAVGFIEPLFESRMAERDYYLFHAVMQTPVADAPTQGKKRQVIRFTLRGAHTWDKFLPWIRDPQDILAFLDHHFELATQVGTNQDGPIQNALHAFVNPSSAGTGEALKRFDPTEPSFVCGIRYIYQDDKPLQLRKLALLFLPFISGRFFSAPHPIMEPDQMRSFCADWASAVDNVEHSHNIQKAALAVLFGMMNSPHWRPHIIPDKWNLLGYFIAAPYNPEPLRRCLDNPELMDAVSEVENPATMLHWLAISWLNYKELILEVRERLEARTKEVAQRERKADLDMCLSVIDSELTKAEDTLVSYPTSAYIKTKIDNLRQAKVSLVVLMSNS